MSILWAEWNSISCEWTLIVEIESIPFGELEVNGVAGGSIETFPCPGLLLSTRKPLLRRANRLPMGDLERDCFSASKHGEVMVDTSPRCQPSR
ncbi:hypothetical protein ACHAXS_011669 [Conticribra weissflogii]